MLEHITSYFQNESVLLQAELFARIIMAVVCGGAIGYERNNRGKGAGIRTHVIVAIASCLMMTISLYGFDGFFGHFNAPNVDARLDPSRIASQIVSGIGFLGAGMIFVQKNVITGLTTAAGIWATAGIGMAIGCGMYFMGIACTCIIVIIQIVLHRNIRFLNIISEKELAFTLEDNPETITFVMETLGECDITVSSIGYQRKEDGLLKLTVNAQASHDVSKVELFKRLYQNDSVKSATL